MNKYSIPAGFKDLILGECESKKQIQLKIESCLNHWGYHEIVTPSIEYYDTYQNGFEEVNQQEAFKFVDPNGKIVMLRADMTIPIARVVATKLKDIEPPMRFRYCASVFKSHAELSGQMNEISDLGVELIGVDSKSGDLEILVTAMEALRTINRDFTLEIGNVNFFREALNEMNLSEEQNRELVRLIGNRSLVELDEYMGDLTLDEKYKQFLKELPWMNGDESVFSKLKAMAFSEKLKEIVISTEKLAEDLKNLGYVEEINFDFAKISNLDYYTGLVFDAFVEGVGVRVMSGGRYDNLISKFGRDLPAVGFSIKLDTLIDETNLDKKRPYQIIEYPDALVVDAIRKANELITNNNVELKVNNSLNEIRIRKGQD